ncbi:arylsulfatase [Flavobacterium zhairuonense]|uniref:arylsulfatase n=1 Tax=Flavobacterium zhairuonense TaxID=2493631 RepID=UPI00104B17C8|nr:arylsulfatase [Flavobacterium zhairuonense]KAF2506885.1 arylsulfatase [Flavobacterium zhairuonense]
MNYVHIKNLYTILMIILISNHLLAQEKSKGENANTPKIDRTILPVRAPSYPPVTELDAKNVTPPPHFEVKAPEGAPNVLIILLDDFGFGQPSTFGGPIPMPTADKLADEGLRYNMFHTTSMCAPTRAALLSGRNSHSVNMGTITELSTSMIGYTGERPQDVATLAETLKQNGYNTAHFGKTHEVPSWQYSVTGKYNNWPTQSGMEVFYGFFGGEADQYNPGNLVEGQTKIPPPGTKDYHFMKDMTDHAISYVRQQKSLSPDKPFFVYFASGATHAPHHVPKEWIAKFKGKFDMGWDKLREETLERQKKLGVVPQNTVLAPKPKDIQDWDKLSPQEKKLYAHQMEVFAAYANFADYEIGRLIKSIDDLGVLDNTLVFYIMGDNGASGEGRLHGVFNEMSTLNGVDEPIEMQVKMMDNLGGPDASNHYAAGWAVAGDAPFAWVKQVASNFGGTRNGLVIHWPKGIKSHGEVRSQFHHVIDIAPTILEAAKLPQPKEVNGFKQRPIEGVSMMYTFEDAKAKSHRTTQYFEINANRGIYSDGWFAGTIHLIPWIPKTSPVPLTEDKWELYNVDKDFSLAHDLAASNPTKVKEMEELFMNEAAKYNVLPIDGRYVERFNAQYAGRPELFSGRNSITLYQGTSLPLESYPNVKNHSFEIKMDLEIPTGKTAQGVLLANGGGTGGWVLFVKNGKPIFDFNYLGQEHLQTVSPKAIPPGKHKLVYEFDYEGGKEPGKGGKSRIILNGKVLIENTIPKTLPYGYALESMDVGRDLATRVSGEYVIGEANSFNGIIKNMTLTVK